MLDWSTRNVDAINQEAIVSLAQEMHWPLPIVRQVYEDQFTRLKAEARVTDYLVLFAGRRTRAALLAMRPQSQGLRANS
jgi:Protein of unknown function (DUF3562)